MSEENILNFSSIVGDSNLIDEKDVDNCQEKVIEYIYNNDAINNFTFTDYICLTYLWIGINGEKAVFVIKKMAPTIFDEIMNVKTTSWDNVVSLIVANEEKFKANIFKVILMDVLWEIYKNSINKTEDVDD